MKSEIESMEMIAAYRELGSFRAAAELCGTTHKTVKRAWLREQGEPERTARQQVVSQRRTGG